MLRSQRLATLCEMIDADGSITVDDIVAKLNVSPATARRDLDALASQGLIHRTHGGARSTAIAVDRPLALKRSQHATEKVAIAEKCITLLEPGCVVGLSGGSTVGALATKIGAWASDTAARYTPQPVATIVTNAVDIAYQLGGTPGLKIVLLGGILNGSSYELTGPVGVSNLEHFSLDVAFLGANGIDDNGPGTVDEFEAHTNSTMASRAHRAFVVADSSKFGRRSFSSLGSRDVVSTIVTDDAVDPRWKDRLQSLGYTVITVPVPHH